MSFPGILCSQLRQFYVAENEQDAGVLANPQAIVPHHVAENHGNGQAAGELL